MQLKDKEVEIVGLKSQGKETELYSGVNQKPLSKVSKRGRKHTCIIYYVASTKNFTFVKLSLYNCLMTDQEIRLNNLLKVI